MCRAAVACFLKHKFYSKISILFLLSFFARTSAANQIPIQYLGIEKGLSNNNVTCIFRDHYGFMWFGTFQGLNRYDGYEFKVFKNALNDQKSLLNNYVSAIAEDQENNIWVGTQRGISIFSNLTSTFRSLDFMPFNGTKKVPVSSYINGIKVDNSGSKFIASKESGLLFYRNGLSAAIQIPLDDRESKKPVYNYNAQSVSLMKNQIWVFVQQKGLYIFNPKSQKLELVNASISKANCLVADNQQTLWLGTNDGFYSYNILKNSYQYYGKSAKNVITSFCTDKNCIWVGTDGGGIFILDLATQKISRMLPGNEKNTLNSGAIYTIFKDQDSRKWIGTLRGGVNVIDPKRNKFKLVEHNLVDKNSINNNFILSFCEDKNNNVWIGTDGAGINYWDRKQNIFTNLMHHDNDPKSLSNNYVTNILQDKKNNIWITTYGGGINKYNNLNHNFEHFTCYNDVTKKAGAEFWCLLQDRNNNLWAGAGSDGGLYRFDQAQNKFRLFDASVNIVFCLMKDHLGQLWAGTFNSLIKVDTVHKKHQIIKLNYPVRAIHEDKNHQLWLGTEGGALVKFNPENNKIDRVTEANGLSNNSILNILEDAKQNLWLSSYNGITKYNPNTQKTEHYFESDGLQSNQFNYNAAVKLQSGEFLFGGIKGFNIFYPDSIKADKHATKVLLTGFKINNIPLAQDASFTGKNCVLNLQNITIPYEKAALTIDFSAPEYSFPDKINYKYFLDGWDKTWNEASKLRTANYSRLTEGNYILRICATNTNGDWNDNQTIIHIKILPPWYRTWWAYLAYISAFSGAVYYYFRYQQRQFNLKQEVAITHIKADKERELNEKRLSFFTNISHEFRTPLTLIINPIKDILGNKNNIENTDDLNIIYRNARRLLSLVDQLLIFRKAEAETDRLKIARLDFPALCHDIFLCFSQQTKRHNINYQFLCENESIEVFADREKMELILFNLISNALKFTPDNGSISVEIKEDDENIFLIVKDNGCGISAETEQKLFDRFYQAPNKSPLKNGFGIGLYLVKSFVDSHQGKISYQTAIGLGTSFSISLRKGKAHFPADIELEDDKKTSLILDELIQADFTNEEPPAASADHLQILISDQQSLLIIDDDQEIREYITHIFDQKYKIYTAEDAESAFKIAQKKQPDLIISDLVLPGESGIDFCNRIKNDANLSHIPVILLTASASVETKLKGLEEGADDYISKPFDKDVLFARVNNLLKSRENLQKYFYNEITLKNHDLKISEEYKSFLNKCICIVEENLSNPDFNIKVFAAAIGMSHSNLYKKVKSISGQSVNGFIRFVRLRKAASLLINTDLNVNEVAFQIGFNDLKYFREHFNKLFGVNPSEYIRKHRIIFHKNYTLNEKSKLKP